jgi:FkbH-like protein
MNVLKAITSREREWPLSELAGKVARRARESAAAAIFLRACTHVGRGARVIGKPLIRNEGRIVIGRRLRLTSRWNPVEFVAEPGGAIEIGDDVAINYGTLVSARSRVRIGHRAQIGNLCIIADTELPNASADGGKAYDEPQPIEIGDDVWLAVRVTVMPGARIGDGAVITAGSVVTGTIPRRVVAGGVPARVLRSLDLPDGDEQPADGPGEAEPAAPAVAAVAPAHQGLLVADFTVDELAQVLSNPTERPTVAAQVAPFNQVTQSLLAEAPADARDFVVVWTRPETAVPSFARLIESEPVKPSDLMADVDAFCDLVVKAAAQYRFVFVPTWTTPHWYRGLGLLDAREGGARALTAMNLRLMERLADTGNVHVLNAQRWIDAGRGPAYAPKPWYLGKIVFPTAVLEEAARDVKAALGALTGLARKLIVVDLDDTMWGGTVGELGWQNLRLGGHDAHGEAFADFQRALKALSRRGILIAIASKNDEAVALEAIGAHPEMLLRQKDFVGWRINWSDKAQNIADLASELNLGLQSFVFIDNDRIERARVREALPEVLVPEWPEDPLFYARALHALTCFDTPALTQADANRAELYAAEREREQVRGQVGSVEEWLKSLDMRIRVESLSKDNLPRVAQLFNKTNQMNLATRRLTADELLAWTAEPGRSLWAVTVSDRFGDAGLTGIISLDVTASHARIVDFLLSCRVMGRKVENTMLHVAVSRARELKATTVEAVYVQTAKNKPCLEFWKRSGFDDAGDSRFVWSTQREYAMPADIVLEQPS